MASKNKLIEMIGCIKTIYPYYAKDVNVEVLLRTWEMLLKQFPDEVVEVAFYQCLQVCKMPPTPAEIIEKIKCMQQTLEPTDEELWAVYQDALIKVLDLIPRFQYTYVDSTGISQGEQARRKVRQIWEGLPEKVRMYVATEGELMRAARSLDYEGSSYEKGRFMKTMPIIAKRQESTLMLESVGNMRLLGGGD